MHETNLDEIILCAAQNRPLDGFGDLTDMHLHAVLRQLYADFGAGIITKEDAAKLKDKCIAAWKSDKDTEEQYRKAAADWSEKIRLANQTGKELHKADSLRSFAADAAVIVELLCGEVGLVEMVGKLQ